MTPAEQTFVIVGAGLAGAKAAGALRTQKFNGRIVMLGDESEHPYNRPPLSKDYLQGKSEKDKIYVHPDVWYVEHDVGLRLDTRVTAIDRSTHQVSSAGGEDIHYDRLLLATGSSPRRLNLAGADLDGVLYLRGVDDCEAMKTAFETAKRVVIIGAGWIGLETAAAARAAGCEVTVGPGRHERQRLGRHRHHRGPGPLRRPGRSLQADRPPDTPDRGSDRRPDRRTIMTGAMTSEKLDLARRLASQLRVDSIRCRTLAGSGHPTSSLSAADLMAVLLVGHLHYDWDQPHLATNDHLIFSKGHASPLLYSMFRAVGVIDEDELVNTYRQLGARLAGHRTPVLPWVDVPRLMTV